MVNYRDKDTNVQINYITDNVAAMLLLVNKVGVEMTCQTKKVSFPN